MQNMQKVGGIGAEFGVAVQHERRIEQLLHPERPRC